METNVGISFIAQGSKRSPAKSTKNLVIKFEAGLQARYETSKNTVFTIKATQKSGNNSSKLIDLSSSMIAQKIGNDLILHFDDETRLVLDNFFTHKGKDKTYVVLSFAGEEENFTIHSDAKGFKLADGSIFIAAHGEPNALLDMVRENGDLLRLTGKKLSLSSKYDNVDNLVAASFGAVELDELLGVIGRDGASHSQTYTAQNNYNAENHSTGGNSSVYLGLGVAGAAAAGGGGGGGAVVAAGAQLITVSVVLGPLSDKGAGSKIIGYKADGSKLGDFTYNANTGLFEYSDATRYSGVLYVVYTDHDDAADYRDEATGEVRNIGDSALMTATLVDGAKDKTDLSINEATTAAAKKIGLDADKDGDGQTLTRPSTAPDGAAVTGANKAVAKALGLGDDFDLSQQEAVSTLNEDGDSNAAANEYGIALHILSEMRRVSDEAPDILAQRFAKGISDDGRIKDDGDGKALVSDILGALNALQKNADLSEAMKTKLTALKSKINALAGELIVPEMPLAIKITASTDTGVSDSDGLTNDTNFILEIDSTNKPTDAILQYRFNKIDADDGGSANAWTDSLPSGSIIASDGDGTYVVEARYKVGDAADVRYSASVRTDIKLDTTAPNLHSTYIDVASGSGIGGAHKIGDNLVLEWNNGRDGDNNGDIWKVEADLSAIGGDAKHAMTLDSATGVWKATYALPLSLGKMEPDITITVTDKAGNSKTAPHTAGFVVDTTAPTLLSTTEPSTALTGDGNSVGDTIALTITFSEKVTGLIVGNDTTIFTVNGTGVEAVWSGVHSTDVRTLTYTIQAGQNGQVAIDKEKLKETLIASIKDFTGNAFSGDIADIDTGESGLPVVDGTAPTLSSTIDPSTALTGDGSTVGSTIALTITFSEAVNGLTGGNDSTIFTVGGTNVAAVWSGTDGETTRILTYTIQAGDNGQAAIDEAALKTTLLAAGITDGAGNALVISDAIADIDTGESGLPIIETTPPTLSSTINPSTALTGDGNSVGDTIALTITFSENVNGLTGGSDSTIFTVGGTNVTAVWSGTDGTNTRILTYTIQAGDSGQAAIDESALRTALLGANITDGASNALVISGDIADIDTGANALPVVDGTAPTLSTITAPTVAPTMGDGDSVGDTIALTITFSEAVKGLTSGESTGIFTVGDAGVEAVWSGTDGTNVRTLTYTVLFGQNGTLDINETALKTAFLAASITDNAGNAFTHSGNIADIDSSGLPTVVTSVPIVTFTEGTTLSNWSAYDEGTFYNVKIEYSQALTVDTSGGIPTITINLGEEIRTLNYIRLTNDNKTLNFSYEVQDTDIAGSIFYFSDNAVINLNGATIQVADGLGAHLTYSGPFKDKTKTDSAADYINGYKNVEGTTTGNDTFDANDNFLESFVWASGTAGGEDTINNFFDFDKIDLSAIVSGYSEGAEASLWVSEFSYSAETGHSRIVVDLDGDSGPGSATQTIILADSDFANRYSLDTVVENGNMVLG